MKRNIAHLLAYILVGLILSGCSDEKSLAYSDLKLDTQHLVIDLDESNEGIIHITNGNGNYKIILSDETIATAIVDDNKIVVTGLETGKTEITIIDWAKKTVTAEVVVKKLEELLLVSNNMSLLVGESKTNSVFTGNGEYTIESSDENIAKGTIDNDGNIIIEGISNGAVTFEIIDAKGKSTEMQVKVNRPLLLSRTENVNILYNGESLEIDILDGNGGYGISVSSTYYLKARIEGTKAIIEVNSSRYGKANTTVTIKDQENISASIHVMFVDNPYLDNIQRFRYFVDENTLSQSTGYYGNIVHSADFNLSQLYVKSSATSSYATGFGVRFTGDLSVGAKSNASWFKIASGVINESTVVPASDLRIDKVEDEWYWVSFMTEGKSLRSYIILKNSN